MEYRDCAFFSACFNDISSWKRYMRLRGLPEMVKAVFTNDRFDSRLKSKANRAFFIQHRFDSTLRSFMASRGCRPDSTRSQGRRKAILEFQEMNFEEMERCSGCKET